MLGRPVFNATSGVDEAAQLNSLLDSLREAGVIQGEYLVDDVNETFRTEKGYFLSLGAPAADYAIVDRELGELADESGDRIEFYHA